MTIENAIQYALEGKAILFLGSGFSKGAVNQVGLNFPLGSQVCERLIKDGNIDVSQDSLNDQQDLAYISERYLESNTREDLLRFLKKEFVCKSCSESHKIIAGIKWKRIYTTNYDNVMETATSFLGEYRESICPTNRTSDILQYNNAIIHMNGSILNVTSTDLDDTFKLLMRSYQKRTLPESDWAISLNGDIFTSKCIIFIGYSMDYDLELQQIFASFSGIKDKCVFISWNPSPRNKRNMEKFGVVYPIGVDKFAEMMQKEKNDYICDDNAYELQCLKKVEIDISSDALDIKDKDVTDLFFYGKLDMRKMSSIGNKNYIIERTCCEEIKNTLLNEYKAVIVHSDIGNGKTLIMRELEVLLNNYGTVFYLDKMNPYIQDDMNYICTLRGRKFIFIENYNRIIDSIYVKIFARYQHTDIKYVFSVRSYLNDNLFQRFIRCFNIPEQLVLMYDVNELNKNELNCMKSLLDKYALWGEKASFSNNQKYNYLVKRCKGEIKNVMLDLLKSEYMSNKIKKLLEILFCNSDLKEITLLIFVCQTIAVELTLDEIVILLNKQIKSAAILKNENVHEFLDFSRNKVKLKSPLIAYFILQNYAYDQDIEELLKRILPILDRHSSIEKYKNMLRMLISYSNLRMIFSYGQKRNYQRYIRIYEYSKNLTYHYENPFFWLQYAILRMEEKNYKLAEIYLKDAESYSKKRFHMESWQIDTHKARLLLERTIEENDKSMAFENFQSAYYLLRDNSTPDKYYVLRQISLFEPYYQKFYNCFSEEEKAFFLYACIEIEKTLKKYLSTQEKMKIRNTYHYREIENNEKMLKRIKKHIITN